MAIFPLPLGTRTMAALGAIEVAVFPVLEAGPELQEPAIFVIAFVGLPGQAAENSPDQHGVAQQEEDQIQRLHRKDGG